jgi:signal peptidase I
MVAADDDKRLREYATIRDTVESIWVAIVLAFVLRAFIIEAFVIPTGSMAPRLLGEHWQVTCQSCGWEYAAGSSRDFQRDAGAAAANPIAQCPNCGYSQPVDGDRRPPDSGDRVLVMKYLYRFVEPAPWDVVVFRNPQNNRENYIKRLIGLPGETIQIVHGDVFYKSSATDDRWSVRRKPADAQEAMWQVVYNNDYQPDPDWRKQHPLPAWRGDDGWDLTPFAGRVFAFAGSDDWKTVTLDADRETFYPRYGYNDMSKAARFGVADTCTDLELSVTFFPQATDSAIRLELTSFSHVFRAEVSADGLVRLLHATGPDGQKWMVWDQKQLKPLEKGKGYNVRLAHVDYQAYLTFEGQRVLASTDEQYSGGEDAHDAMVKLMQAAGALEGALPVPQVSLAAKGGRLSLWHVNLQRDVFYTQGVIPPIDPGPLGDFARELRVSPNQPGWGTMANPIVLAEHKDDPDLAEFFVLGDNSPFSLDSRYWTSAAPSLRLHDAKGKPVYALGTVPRYNMTGKGMFVYWPAGFRLPGQWLQKIPIIPNVGKMRFIR